mgnify:CR=1 FL=1
MDNQLKRIIQETVPGKQCTLAHIIARPNQVLYQKLGLNPNIDTKSAGAIGIMTLTPGEMAIIAGDLATKASDIEIGFIDRFSGTLIILGTISQVDSAFRAVLDYARDVLDFTVTNITKA